jgi:hypothetical protein
MEPQPKPRFEVDGAVHTDRLTLALPAGSYRVAWMDPKTGRTISSSRLRVRADTAEVESPSYQEDIVLEIESGR